MSSTAKELTDLAAIQRKKGQCEEALASALAATKANPDSANAWWQVALSRIVLGDPRKAIPAFERTVELSPHFGPGWIELGNALLKTGDEGAALNALERALEEEPNSVDAMRGLADIYSKQHGLAHTATKEQRQTEIAVLAKLERQTTLSSPQRNRLGNLYYNNGDYWMAEPYWRRDAANGSAASRFNLGLLYSNHEVSREADAIDTWRRVLAVSPDYEPLKKSLAIVLPNVLKRAATARSFGPTLLPAETVVSQLHQPYPAAWSGS
jgi:tetratricopeptide (TPR) repeat protein